MHIRVYVKFHFHLHLQSYLSNWHIIYVVNYIRGNINVQHLLFAGVRTAATVAPNQPEPSSSPARASRPKRSVPHSCPARADATEDPGAGRSGATVVVVAGGDEVTGSRRDGLGSGEDMIEPKLADTKLLWCC